MSLQPDLTGRRFKASTKRSQCVKMDSKFHNWQGSVLMTLGSYGIELDVILLAGIESQAADELSPLKKTGTNQTPMDENSSKMHLPVSFSSKRKVERDRYMHYKDVMNSNESVGQPAVYAIVTSMHPKQSKIKITVHDFILD